MILNRLGNKRKIAGKIYSTFPKHTTYCEPFFGGGGMFFAKQLAKYNYVNDLDSDVFNLYQVVLKNRNELYRQIELAPYHSDLLKYWKKNKETGPVMQAVRFLFLSNYSYLGKMDTLRFLGKNNIKKILLSRIEQTFEKIKYVQFNNCDFRKFIKSIYIGKPKQVLFYCDPPYLDTGNNYSAGFVKKDLIDLIELLLKTKSNFAISEFENKIILDLAKKYKLNILTIGERKSLKNKNIELLLTNYEVETDLFI